MNKFKMGDRVRRTKADYRKTVKDGVYTVLGEENSKLYLAHDPNWSYSPNSFEPLIEEPKPWLKITPPTPEKRELVDEAVLPGGYKLLVCDCRSRDGFDSVRIEEGPFGIDKVILKKLGETLIEISKEMK